MWQAGETALIHTPPAKFRRSGLTQLPLFKLAGAFLGDSMSSVWRMLYGVLITFVVLLGLPLLTALLIIISAPLYLITKVYEHFVRRRE